MPGGIWILQCLKEFARLGVLLLCWDSVSIVLARRNGDYQSVCEFEEVQAECQPPEVIVVTSAKYGRMEMGKCVQNSDTLGCFADVLDIADQLCSGKSSCEISVPNKRMKRRHTEVCKHELTPYLEISYKCERVQTGSGRNCRTCASAPLTPSQAGIIASNVSYATGCGLHRCPWVLSAEPGQQVNVTLVNFRWGDSASTGSASQCVPYATVKEATSSGLHTICAERHRETAVYSSLTSAVEIRLIPPDTEEEQAKRNFFLKYEVVGCPDPTVPRGAWVQRSYTSAKVHCNATHQVWDLSCRGGQWAGPEMDAKDCRVAGGVGGSGSSIIRFAGISITSGVALTVIISLALVVGVVILCCGIVIVRRKRALDAIHNRKKAAPYTLPHSTAKRLSRQSSQFPTTSYPHVPKRRYWDRPLPDKPESESEDSDVMYMHRPGSEHSGYNSIRTVRVDVVPADGETGQSITHQGNAMTSSMMSHPRDMMSSSMNSGHYPPEMMSSMNSQCLPPDMMSSSMASNQFPLDLTSSMTSQQYIPADRRSIASNHSSSASRISQVYENEIPSPQRRPQHSESNGKRASIVHRRLSQLSQNHGHSRANSDVNNYAGNEAEMNHAPRPKPQVPVKPVAPVPPMPPVRQPLLKTMKPNNKCVRYDLDDQDSRIHLTA